ncbi:MAG: sulfotransferase [Calditrichia bacterium]
MAVRVPQFSRNVLLERLLNRLNSEIVRLPDDDYDAKSRFKHPLVFLVGCPRSGSTLMLQWLASSGKFAFPDNFMSRFYKAPFVALLIQDMLFNPAYQFRNEFSDFNVQTSDFASVLGKTSGSLSVNEFYYFWRNYLPASCEYPSAEEMQRFQLRNARFEISRILDYQNRPFVCKGLLFNHVLPEIASFFPEAVFINIERDPFFTAQSLLQARETYWGERNSWYSFAIPEKQSLLSKNPLEQVAGQVLLTKEAVKRGLARISPGRQLTVAYEELCDSPKKVWKKIMPLLSLDCSKQSLHYSGPDGYENGNFLRFSVQEREELCTYLGKFTRDMTHKKKVFEDAI